MQIHGPSTDFAATDVTVELNATRPQDPFITILWPSGVRIYLDDGEADYLIKVILQAKDMLHAHRHAVACNAGLGEYNSPYTAASAAEVAEGLPVSGPWTPRPHVNATTGEVYMACVDSPVEVTGDAQAAEVKRIGQLHADGLITSAKCAGMVDKVLAGGRLHADALAAEQTARDIGGSR